MSASTTYFSLRLLRKTEAKRFLRGKKEKDGKFSGREKLRQAQKVMKTQK